MSAISVHLADSQATLRLGQLLGRELARPAVIALTGDLGAGKTCLTRGIARGMGIAAAVTSPTFTLIQEYPGPHGNLYHIDVYRLADTAALFDLGFEEYLADTDGIIVVEWAGKVQDLLPRDTLGIHLEHNTQGRQVTLVLPASLAGLAESIERITP